MERSDKRQSCQEIKLADRLGRHQSFVSKVESGESWTDLVELHRYCDALGVSLLAMVRRFLKAVSG